MTTLCDPELLNEAQRLGLHQTKKETLNSALQAYIEKCKRKAVLDAFGSFDFDETYDYKKGCGEERTAPFRSPFYIQALMR